jgi:hypothetical protein
MQQKSIRPASLIQICQPGNPGRGWSGCAAAAGKRTRQEGVGSQSSWGHREDVARRVSKPRDGWADLAGDALLVDVVVLLEFYASLHELIDGGFDVGNGEVEDRVRGGNVVCDFGIDEYVPLAIDVEGEHPVLLRHFQTEHTAVELPGSRDVINRKTAGSPCLVEHMWISGHAWYLDGTPSGSPPAADKRP